MNWYPVKAAPENLVGWIVLLLIIIASGYTVWGIWLLANNWVPTRLALELPVRRIDLYVCFSLYMLFGRER